MNNVEQPNIRSMIKSLHISALIREGNLTVDSLSLLQDERDLIEYAAAKMCNETHREGVYEPLCDTCSTGRSAILRFLEYCKQEAKKCTLGK
jgi:hypothetical protein